MNKKTTLDLEKSCLCCEHSIRLEGSDTYLCPKNGVVEYNYSCGRFRLDALKIIPRPAPPLPEYNHEDFAV